MASSASGVALKVRGDDVDLTIYQGKTINFALIWGGASPVDVTGWDSRMVVRSVAPDTPALIAEFKQANNRVAVGGVDGRFEYSMDADDCAALAATQNARWEIEVIDPDGTVYLGQSGKAKIIGEQAS